MQNMETHYTHSPADICHYSAEQSRNESLVGKVSIPGAVSLTYTHNDRMIFGGVTPTTEELEIILDKGLGVDYFLEHHELGVINIGGPGFIEIDGAREAMKKQDGYHIGEEIGHARSSSEDSNNPAKFCISRTPAHHKCPNVRASIDEITPMKTGDPLVLNQRKIYQYIHPNVCENCRLQTGYTISESGSVWSIMPRHAHERRMEAYTYLDMEEDTRIFYMMDKPDETKHLVMSSK